MTRRVLHDTKPVKMYGASFMDVSGFCRTRGDSRADLAPVPSCLINNKLEYREMLCLSNTSSPVKPSRAALSARSNNGKIPTATSSAQQRIVVPIVMHKQGKDDKGMRFSSDGYSTRIQHALSQQEFQGIISRLNSCEQGGGGKGGGNLLRTALTGLLQHGPSTKRLEAVCQDLMAEYRDRGVFLSVVGKGSAMRVDLEVQA